MWVGVGCSCVLRCLILYLVFIVFLMFFEKLVLKLLVKFMIFVGLIWGLVDIGVLLFGGNKSCLVVFC